jgi:hypothetical protein
MKTKNYYQINPTPLATSTSVVRLESAKKGIGDLLVEFLLGLFSKVDEKISLWE